MTTDDGTLSLNERRALLTSLRFLDLGVLLLDRSRRVCFANSEAMSLLKTGDGLVVHGDELTADGPGASELEAAWRGVMRGGKPRLLCVPRRSGRHCYQLALIPCVVDSEVWVTAYVADPASDLPNVGPILASLWGLTSAESSVASLIVGGHDLTQIADARGVTHTTVRHQLRRIFDKTGARRQVDLVRLVLRGVLGSCLNLSTILRVRDTA